MTSSSFSNQDPMANAIRALSMDAVQQAASGHPGMPMGMADVATVLWSKFLKFDASALDWFDRDRFILSAGHGSMLLYSLLYLTGFKEMGLEQIKAFRQLGSKTAGHPEYRHAPGIEVTTGMLGQGFANAVGFALAEKLMATRFGEKIVNHKTYVIASDGDLMEGISQEAASLAGTLSLSKLVVLFDDNNICIDGAVDQTDCTDQRARFEAMGWQSFAIDGHNRAEIEQVLTAVQSASKPSLIACKTTIGFGAPKKAGTADVHGSPLGPDEIKASREALGWDHPPFEIPQDLLSRWREIGAKHRPVREKWRHAVGAMPEAKRSEFYAALTAEFSDDARQALKDHIETCQEQPAKNATRKSSGLALNAIAPHAPNLLGGSADLTGSNLTKATNQKEINSGDFSGNYLHYGVREHGMAAIMNGLAAHGGIVPYGGTFFVFTDYCRPAIRMAALMGLKVIYVMTHDSVGLGEDGPTHQPVEHLASLRAMPGLRVMRPCDDVETAECWEIALSNDGPSMLVLSRQGTELLRKQPSPSNENLSAAGAYILSSCPNGLDEKACLISSGTEVSLAMQAQKLLAEKKIGSRIVSMPSWDLFASQSKHKQEEILGSSELIRAAIEAGSGFGWEKWLGRDGIFVGMHSFGGSAPSADLYQHFGITAEKLAEAVEKTVATFR